MQSHQVNQVLLRQHVGSCVSARFNDNILYPEWIIVVRGELLPVKYSICVLGAPELLLTIFTEELAESTAGSETQKKGD